MTQIGIAAIMTAAPLPLGCNVDSLASVHGADLLVAGLSSFTGRYWDGHIAVIGDGGLQTRALLPVRAGLPSVACLPLADEFTGRRVVASGADDGSVDLWYLSTGGGSSSSSSGAPPQLEHAQAKVMHDASVLSLAAADGSPGGNRLASASADGTVRLWDCSQLLTSTAHLGSAGGPSVNAVAWTAEPQVLASASADGRLCLWDARQLGGTPAAAAAVGAAALSVAAAGTAGSGPQQLLVVGDQLGRLTVFDARNCSQALQQRQLHGDAVHALAAAGSSSGSGASSGASSAGSLVASGGDDGSILLLDCARLEASRQLAPARQEGEAACYVRCLAWSSGGSAAGQAQQPRQARLFRGGWDQSVQQVLL